MGKVLIVGRTGARIQEMKTIAQMAGEYSNSSGSQVVAKKETRPHPCLGCNYADRCGGTLV